MIKERKARKGSCEEKNNKNLKKVDYSQLCEDLIPLGSFDASSIKQLIEKKLGIKINLNDTSKKILLHNMYEEYKEEGYDVKMIEHGKKIQVHPKSVVVIEKKKKTAADYYIPSATVSVEKDSVEDLPMLEEVSVGDHLMNIDPSSFKMSKDTLVRYLEGLVVLVTKLEDTGTYRFKKSDLSVQRSKLRDWAKDNLELDLKIISGKGSNAITSTELNRLELMNIEAGLSFLLEKIEHSEPQDKKEDVVTTPVIVEKTGKVKKQQVVKKEVVKSPIFTTQTIQGSDIGDRYIQYTKMYLSWVSIFLKSTENEIEILQGKFLKYGLNLVPRLISDLSEKVHPGFFENFKLNPAGTKWTYIGNREKLNEVYKQVSEMLLRFDPTSSVYINEVDSIHNEKKEKTTTVTVQETLEHVTTLISNKIDGVMEYAFITNVNLHFKNLKVTTLLDSSKRLYEGPLPVVSRDTIEDYVNLVRSKTTRFILREPDLTKVFEYMKKTEELLSILD